MKRLLVERGIRREIGVFKEIKTLIEALLLSTLDLLAGL